jgi:hypothetical protein
VRDEDDAPEVRDSHQVSAVEGAIDVAAEGVDGAVRVSVGGWWSHLALNGTPVVAGGCDLLQVLGKIPQ